jgi:hydrogenase maturation protease
MPQPTILIACIGNIFLGDDGFGCEVAKVLQTRQLPETVKLFDYGIRGYDLAYALLDGYDVTIFVDAVPQNDTPGTLYIIEPDLSEFENAEAEPAMLDGHTMNPSHVLRMAHQMGAKFGKIRLVGCVPETFGGEQGQMSLSEPVQAAVIEAANMVESLIEKVLTEDQKHASA